MRVGVPTEVKDTEHRVALTPAGVDELVRRGHDVLVQAGAGTGSSIADADFAAAGAKLVDTAGEVWAGAELLLKVKEPVPAEYQHLRAGQLLFTYLHLAADGPLTRALLASGTTALAYETVQPDGGSLPLLAPMSEVAGRLAPQVGAQALLRGSGGRDGPHGSGGRGMLLGGVPGVHPARVVVLGAGVAGSAAIAIAAGMGADVVALDRDLEPLRALDRVWRGRVRTVAASAYAVRREVRAADLVIGAVLVAGAKAPVLVSDALVATMKPGSVLVDIAVDQGGCFESSRPTTHTDPTFPVAGSLFYCVANMPGAVPHTSTHALTNATLPYVLALAAGGLNACRADPALARGLAVAAGRLTSAPVGAAHDLPVTDTAEVLA